MATTTACDAVESHQSPLPRVRKRFCIRHAVGQRLSALLREDPDSRPTRILAREIMSTLQIRASVIRERGSAPCACTAYPGSMTRPTKSQDRAAKTGPQPEVEVDRDATDDEFERAYRMERPRWNSLADRLK